MPEQSVAGFVLTLLTRYAPAKDSTDLLLYVCNILLDLWSRCLEDHYVSACVIDLQNKLLTDGDSMLHFTPWWIC